MPIATNAQKETLAIAYGNAALYGSCHTAAPGTTGASEVTGGTYARKALSWTAGASDGVVSVAVTFDIPTGVTVTHVGVWSALTAGNFLDSADITDVSFSTGAGQLTVTFTYTQS